MSRRYTLQDEAILVDELNHLLHSLALPLSLISPTDLTPRLLIAILESLLGARLPAPMMSTHAETQTARVQHMKIFLGVLETDILQRDVGLSTVDPRALAEGDDDAVFYVAEVLAAISRDRDRELARARSVPLPRTPSPSPPPSPLPITMPMARPPLSPKSQLDLDAESLFQTGMRTTHPSLFSPFLAAVDNSTTSLFSDHHEDEYGRVSDESSDADTGVSDILSGLPPLPSTPPTARHQHHHHDSNGSNSDSLLFSVVDNPPIPRERAFTAYHYDHDRDYDDNLERGNATLRPRVPIRYDGFIAPVDEVQELASFELSRSRSSSMSTRILQSHPLSPSASSPSTRTPPSVSRSRSSSKSKGESVKAQYTRTLELLTERARLLTQLSDLRKTKFTPGHEYEYDHERGHGHG